MSFTVEVEKTSNIVRKLTIKVPATTVSTRIQTGLVEAQRYAQVKGFRPGNVPLNLVKQMYGADVRHRVFHNLIDEFYGQALREQKLRAVSQPKIETPEHMTGQGAHDHSIEEGKDLTFTATVEVVPEIEVKGYTGLALTRDKVEVKDEDVDGVIKNILEGQAELAPVGSGLLDASGNAAGGREARMGDFVDMAFSGGLVKDDGSIEEKPGMKGSRMLELGSNQLIEGFEEQVAGMRVGETKTFRVPFPADFYEKELAGKMAEFTVTVNELKEKKLPELNDEFAKQGGYENLADMKEKAREHLLRERTMDVDRRLRSDLLQNLIDKNEFEVPVSLVQAQTRQLAQEVAGNLKQQGFTDQMIQDALGAEMKNLQKRAENQVRASLILEAISKKEKIEVSKQDLDDEIKSMAVNMKVDEDKVREYYSANPARMDDLEFRIREERTIKFLLDKSKIKEK